MERTRRTHGVADEDAGVLLQFVSSQIHLEQSLVPADITDLQTVRILDITVRQR